MSNSDNPYASAGGMQMTGSVNYGGGPAPAPSQAPAGGDDIIDTTTSNFVRDVIEESKSRAVLVDFWAPWCGPCKQLGPIIEKVVTEAGGKVRLVKLNIDDHPAIPGQMGIQSIPAVVAFIDGRPADGFMGAIPESQVKAFIDKMVAQKPVAGQKDNEAQIAAMMEQADAALAAGEPEAAAQIYSAILGFDEGHAGAIGGLASCMIAANALDQAEELLNSLSPEIRQKPEVVAADKQLAQIREAASLGSPAEFEARIADNPADFDARLQLAKILNARGERDQAAEQLFAIMRKERGWNDEAARKQLIEFFEAWGPMDPATLTARRQLSSLLFS